MAEPRPKLFIGSSAEGLDIAKAIQANLDHSCEVTIWHQGVFGLDLGTTLETLANRLDEFDFAVLVLTPDDLTFSRGNEQPSPRDNVLLELGMFIGAIGHERSYVVYSRTDDLKLPTDLAGVTPATYAPHSDGNLRAALGAACTDIEDAVRRVDRRRRAPSPKKSPAEADTDDTGPLASDNQSRPRHGSTKIVDQGKPEKRRIACAYCSGQGSILSDQLIKSGSVVNSIRSTCPCCDGDGEILTSLWSQPECRRCNGTGRLVTETKTPVAVRRRRVSYHTQTNIDICDRCLGTGRRPIHPEESTSPSSS